MRIITNEPCDGCLKTATHKLDNEYYCDDCWEAKLVEWGLK